MQNFPVEHAPRPLVIKLPLVAASAFFAHHNYAFEPFTFALMPLKVSYSITLLCKLV